MSVLGTAAAVLVLLGVLILVHELGHFVFAQAVRREGAALLARLRPAPRSASPAARPSTGCRWCRSAATCACWARIRASRSRRSIGRARWPPSRSGSATRSWSRGRCSTCCCRCSSTSSTTPASGRCCRRRSGRCCPTCRPRTPASCPATASRPSTASRVRYWEELERRDLRLGRQDAALRASGAGPTPRSAT